ncbi:hypothetical protein EV356DRAFT_560098 [Viridothelium virens]|uniref:SnoaL-like domain-containing protein n=1 Tax=Viridothelium virens TaxID=1048519 RepID=A0A6A6H5N3_VIRVR|nr:hypothetical protein EV356DRAFT_560098 [Viridothelium virens]
MSPYPSKDEIAELATHLSTSDPSPFYDRVSPNVVWDVLGTHPAAGHFTSFESWKKSALGVANKFLKEPLRFKVVNAFGGGEQDWCCLELEAIDAVAKNGIPYPQQYCWLLRFDEHGIIVQVRAYVDSVLVNKIADANP